MTQSNFGPYSSHPTGRFVLEWPISPTQTRIATYAVTGKKNDVYVEASHLPHGKWMPRHYFEHWVEATINQLGGRESKPVSKAANWRIKGHQTY